MGSDSLCSLRENAIITVSAKKMTMVQFERELLEWLIR